MRRDSISIMASPPTERTGRSGLRPGIVSLLLAWLAAASTGWAAPSISGFSQPYGSSLDATYVHIYGSGFGNTGLIVTFNGVRASQQYAISATDIEMLPPASPLGPTTVVVTVNGVSAQSPLPFYIVGAGPYVNSFSPTTGADGVLVTLSGEHFLNVINVTFNGVAGANPWASADSMLMVSTPAGVTTGPIKVTTPSGSFTSAADFFAPPAITGFSPTVGRPGTNVTITGANFLGATSVRFNGLPVAVAPANNTNLQVAVPAGVTTGPITIVAPAGVFTTASSFVAQPLITSFYPGSGGPNTLVTITGANLTDGTPTVAFNGVVAVVEAGYTANQLSALVPAGATTGPITVTTASGAATSSSLFYLPPLISGITPNGAPAGSWVRITGANFTDASAVSFNGSAAVTFSVTNNSALNALVPNGVATGPISVTAPAGAASSGTLFFYGTPTIFSCSPLHGLPGTNVVVSGFNLLGTTVVRFNGAAASFTVSNNSTLSASVPAYASSGLITVDTPAGTAASPNPFAIDVSALSVTVAVIPSPFVTVDSNLTYVITVTNSGPYSAVNARLGDTLPDLSRLVAKSTTLGGFTTSPNPAILLCSFGDMASGASAVVTLVQRAPATPGLVTNLASVAADNATVTLSSVMTNFTLVQSQPLLSIQSLPANLLWITWPPDLTNYQLQFKSDPTTNLPGWSNVTTFPVISNLSLGPRNLVIQINGGDDGYYRLER